IFQRPYPETTALLYRELLPRLPELARDVEAARSLWQAEDAHLASSELAIQRGEVTVVEHPDVDLAVVRIPDALENARVHRFTHSREGRVHPMAIHNRTTCFRIALVEARHYELQYRYETWVQYASRRPLPRVDLAPLARQLDAEEGTQVWSF